MQHEMWNVMQHAMHHAVHHAMHHAPMHHAMHLTTPHGAHPPARSSHRLLAAPSQLLHIHLPSWQLSLLSDAAANIAAALLADWFRMDLFLGHPQLELRVNEITYPSHILDTGPLPQCLTPTLTPTLALSMSLTLPLTLPLTPPLTLTPF